jgi:predicted dehydrogenase
VDRLLCLPEVSIVGCADSEQPRANSLAVRVIQSGTADQVPVFTDHRELLRQTAPDVLCVFTPHLWHYRPAMDALQSGCHVFIEKPLSTNVQEAADIVGLARARSLLVAVGHQYRLCPSLMEARRQLKQGSIGKIQQVTATLAMPWLANHQELEPRWQFDPKVAGGGALADAGNHLLDALLWTSGQSAREVCALQTRLESGLDVVTSAAVRLQDGTPVSIAVSGVSPRFCFELSYFGDRGRIRVTDRLLELDDDPESLPRSVPLLEQEDSIDGNFLTALLRGTPLCCPADQAIDTVRLLEAVNRSAATGQIVRVAG